MSNPHFDVIVVGSGAGGLTAAITAKLAGLRPLIIEKTPLLGGSSVLSGGVLWMPNNPVMESDGCADTRERALKYMANFVEPSDVASPLKRREAFVDAVTPMMRAMQQQGMEYLRCSAYADYYEHLPGGHTDRSVQAELFDANRLGSWKVLLRPPSVPVPVRTGEGAQLMRVGITLDGKLKAAQVALRYARAKFRRQTLYGAGGALQGRMLEIALKLGIEIWPNAGLIELDTRAGHIEGVHLSHNGVAKTVRASRGVIVAAGGFARNLKMREIHQRKPASVEWTKANPGDTGDAIEAMQRIGADLMWMDESWWVMTFMSGSESHQIVPELIKPYGILVDASGQRFVNEASSYMAVGRACYARNSAVKAIPAWMIMDSRHRKRYMFGFQPPGRIPKSWLARGWVYQDQTISGLAAKCGIDAEGLQSTVMRFNGFANEGLDRDFERGNNAYARYWWDPTVKPNGSLGALETPPFWAAPLVPGDVGTCGGAVADESARVLREDGSVIEGLYAVGNCAAPLAGPHYIGAGLSIAASSVFGYLAAQHAAT